MKANGIDIIIPIYNAYEDLVKCVDSVKRHTNLRKHRLILINDCSTDDRILPFLKQEENENIIVIDNEKNAGFSNNVNKGMLYSKDRDVLLLNSDTIVTANWVEKIVICAYSKPEIGTVTPLSNSATLCSYPIMCQDNDIPEDWTVDSLARIIERCSMKAYPRITVAVGFCMYIKRETIEAVGLFDAETFERGYGEENDFCNRAEQLGYIHVMCDDTFIYHKGTVSFLSEEKQALIDAHEKILVERYPAQMRKNGHYCSENNDQYIRENINIYTAADPSKKNLMYLVQSDFREDAFDHVGGTQHHVKDLTMQLKDEYNIYVVARDWDYLRVTMYSGEKKVSLKYYIGEKDGYPRLHDTELATLFRNILIAFEINLLHIHHVHGLSFDIFEVAKALEVPMILTMHDYYYICPNVKLVNTDMQHCNGSCDASDCENCLTKNAGIYTSKNYLAKWRENAKCVLMGCDKLIVPSEAAKEVYSEYYPEVQDKIQVIEHGLKIDADEIDLKDKVVKKTYAVKQCFDVWFADESAPHEVRGWAYLAGVDPAEVEVYLEVNCGGDVDFFRCTKSIRKDIAELIGNPNYIYSGFSGTVFKQDYLNKKIKVRLLLEYQNVLYTNGKTKIYTIPSAKVEYKYNVAFLGGMVPEKGSRKALEMIQNSSPDIRWHVFGGTTGDGLGCFNQENVVKHGTYRQQDIPKLLKDNRIDLICIMSIWPETFCYTLSEAAVCDMPMLVTDIGAAGERVKRHGYGWTVPVDYTGAQMSDYVLQILEDKVGYEEKKQIVTSFSEITLREMTSKYRNLYREFAKGFSSKDLYDASLIFRGLGVAKGMREKPYQMIPAEESQVSTEVTADWIILLDKVFKKLKRGR